MRPSATPDRIALGSPRRLGGVWTMAQGTPARWSWPSRSWELPEPSPSRVVTGVDPEGTRVRRIERRTRPRSSYADTEGRQGEAGTSNGLRRLTKASSGAGGDHHPSRSSDYAVSAC